MRVLLLAAAAVLATPAAAQDHADHATSDDAEAKRDHDVSDQGSEDHSSMDHGTMDKGAVDHSAMDHGTMAMDKAAPPPRALEGPAHAADAVYGTAAMAPTRVELARESGGFAGSTIMLDRLEARVGKGSDAYLWDGQGWTGGDIDKLWLKSEGEGTFGGKIEDAEAQVLWSHAIGPWFDLQAGVRYTIEPVARPHLVLGVQGLAPYMFDVDAAAFLSDKGDLTARIEAEYDQRLTQRLILQPRVEFDLAAQDIPEFGIGSGPSKLEAGLRLRYEFVREFAPYVGVEWERKLGGTADAARLAGDDPSRVFLVVGVRTWF